MKQIWKRTMSLALSGILLLGNVPVQAWATEDMVEAAVLEETVTVPETQPAQTAVEAAGPAAASVTKESSNPAFDYPLMVNETMVTSANAPDILGNGTVTFVHSEADGVKTNKLTLKNAAVSSISWGAYAQRGAELIIDLPAGTQSTISGALTSEGDLPGSIKITGKGVLKVGSIQAGANLIIEDAQVLVGGDLAEGEEQKELIRVKNEITIGGTAHLVTASGHKAVVFTDENGGKVVGEGYGRTAKNGEFAAEVDAAECAYLEFLAKDHLEYTSTDMQHMLGCQADCKLDKVTVLTEDHNAEETEFVDIGDGINHKEIWGCCGADKQNVAPQAHNLEYQASGAVISARCKDCNAEGTITIEASNVVADDAQHGATVNKTGILSNAEVTITYAGKNMEASEEAPAAYGRYTASISIGDVTASVDYYITKPITAEDVQLDETTLTYNGQSQTKKVAGKEGVTFEVEGNVQIDAGTYTLTVKGTGIYSGSVELSYTIEKTTVYRDATVKNQTVGTNIGELKLPAFIGYAEEELTGSCTYLWNEQPVEVAGISAKIAALQNGEKATLSYTFTPAADGNYTGETTGSIAITKVDLIVEMEEEGASIVKETITYGDKDIVDVSKLVVKIGEASDDADASFAVKYAMKVNGSYDMENLKDAPDAGDVKILVFYTPDKLGEITIPADVLVYSKEVKVAPKTPSISDANKPKAENLIQQLDAEGKPVVQPLLKEGNEGKTDDGAALEYSLQENGTYSAEIPTAADAGYYEVWYRSPKNSNYNGTVGGRVQVLVIPHLTATYGQTLADIQNQLPEGFTFNKTAHPKLEEATVGNAGENKVSLDYTHPKVKENAELAKDYPSLTGQEAPLTVSPKAITIEASLKNTDGYFHYDDRLLSGNVIVKDKETGKTLTFKTDYTISPVTADDGKKITYTVKPTETPNYTFEILVLEAKLYRPDDAAMQEATFPAGNLIGTDYDTYDKAVAALQKKLKEDTYPESTMKFFQVYMTKMEAKDTWVVDASADACPPSGYAHEIPYADLGKDSTKNDNFKVAVIYLTGDDAGKAIVELEDEDISKTTTGLEMKLDREAIVCVAKEIDLTKEYTIEKAVLLDGKTSSKGSLTIKANSKTVTKATYGTTVEVTASVSSGYSLKSVTATAESGETVAWEKVSEGKYKFTMPASKVTVTAVLGKSTVNGSTGDTSNIQLWTTVLAASGVGILAVLFFWLKKRKK